MVKAFYTTQYSLAVVFAYIFLLLSSFDVKAQNQDYVILTRGDKVPCKISFPFSNVNGQYDTAYRMIRLMILILIRSMNIILLEIILYIVQFMIPAQKDCNLCW